MPQFQTFLSDDDVMIGQWITAASKESTEG
jgi:hypothetical protein